MLMTATLPGSRGTAVVALDFNTKKWSVVSGENAWSGIGASQGTFELPGGVLWLMDPKLSAKDKTIVIVHKAPEYEIDSDTLCGTGRIYRPKVSTLQDGTIQWSAVMSPVRKAILNICRINLPAIGQFPKEPPNCIASKVETGYTNCGSFPGFIAKQLGYYVPWDQGAKLHEQIMKTKGAKAQAIWEETQQKLKIEKQDYKYAILDSEARIGVEGKPASFTSAMAAGWGLGRAEEYPIKLEKIRKLDPGTIWIPFASGKRPQPGDFYVLRRVLPNSTTGEIGFGHVGVVVDARSEQWTTADGGQGQSGFAVGYQKRKYYPSNGDLILDPPKVTERDNGWRQLEGWVNADQLFAGWKG